MNDGACCNNDGGGEGNEKSGGDDATEEIREHGGHQGISDGGWVVVAREGRQRWQ